MDSKPEDRHEIRIRWSDKDGAFVASFPELPFAEARGNTPEEALANAKAAFRTTSGPHAGTHVEQTSTDAPETAMRKNQADAREVGVDLDVLGDA